MEQNSSSVCVATIHKDDQKSTKLLDDAMPLYATIIPANTRKARLQQQQLQQQKQQQQQHQEPSATTKQTFQQQQSQTICSSNHKMSNNENRILSSENKKLNENDNENNYDSTSGESDGDESIELWSNEIPVYVKGEQRWISGVTDQTTCLDIIEALLMDEGIIKSTNDSNNNTNGGNLYPTKVNDYVITERWRRMEQALDGRTKILKIWTAWGTEQSEVRFSLKRRTDSHHSSNQQQQQQHQSQSQTHTTGGGVAVLGGDRDSGRGSPTGSINSAIVRRRRHRASRSTFAWMTHGQTIHPKSSKNNIERLMKLILEQGEVIQLQLAKLRDRELEISNLEEERHKIREKEHGKNYLLETYLKGISNDNDDKQELAAGNSDSGVHTEETAASPEVQHEDEISDTLIPLNEQNLSAVKVSSKKHRRSKREHELMLEHQSTKEYSSAISSEKSKSIVENEKHRTVQEELKLLRNDEEMPMSSEVAAQIDILEKLIVLNKHLQREEELCVRLSAKIKRYEADASGLSEAQVKESLSRVNEQLDAKNCEIAQMESEIKLSDDALNSKTDVLKKLYDDLEEAEVEHRKLEASNDVIDGATALMPPELPPLKSEQFKMLTQNDELNMSREYLAENIYNISKIILKSSGQSMPLNMNNINQNSIEFSRHMPDTLSSSNSAVQPMPMLNQQIYQMPQHTMPSTAEKRVIQAQIHSIPTNIQHTHQLTNNTITDISQFKSTLLQHQQQQQQQNFDQYNKYNEAMRASMNYLATINQRIQKNNHHIESDINNVNNPIIQATQYKLGPKKLLINTQAINGSSSSCNNNSNSNSIIESRNNIYKRNMILQPNDCINLTTQQDVSQLGTLV